MDLHGSFYVRAGEGRGVLGTRLERVICTVPIWPWFEHFRQVVVGEGQEWIELSFYEIPGKILGKRSCTEINGNPGDLVKSGQSKAALEGDSLPTSSWSPKVWKYPEAALWAQTMADL